MKKEILKLTGLTEAEFYKMYPTPDAFASAYPGYKKKLGKKKLGGLTEAFPQIATADNFFSYGVPVPPTYHMSGGPVYPQIQTEAQFFSPIYSNSNNAYEKGGSYMEAYPQAVSYPSHGMGYSNYFMLQDGGPSPEKPSEDQTFYTQKNNDFFDKLRKASYKSLIKEGMEAYSPYPTENQELQRGGIMNFFRGMAPTEKVQWRDIFPQKGLGIGDLTPSQLDAIKSGVANVADISYETRPALFAKNRIKKVNVKFNTPGQQGMKDFKGTPYLIPGQKAFDPTVPGQAATTTAAPAQNQQMVPAPGTQGTSPYGPYLNEFLVGPDNVPVDMNKQIAAQKAQAAASAASPTPLAVPKDVELDDGTYVTEEEAKAKGYTKDSSGNWKSPAVSTPPSNTQSMDPNVAKKKAAMQTPPVNQPYIDAQKPKYTIGKVIPSATPNGSLQSWADIEKAIGPAPKVITGSYFEKINDYCSQFPGAEGCYSEPYSKLPNQENIGPNERRNYFDTEKFKKMPYVQQVLMAIQSPRFRRGANDEIIDPYEVIGAPFRLAADYDTGIGEEYYKTTRDGKRISSSTPFTDLDPAYRFRYSDDANDVYSQFITPEMARELASQVNMPSMMNPGARSNFTQDEDFGYGPAINQKYGGGYALPVYQGAVGPGQTGFNMPWQRTLDITNPANYKLNEAGKSQYVGPDQFELGFDVKRTKKFDPNFSAKVQGLANTIENAQDRERFRSMLEQQLAVDKLYQPVGQDQGDELMNEVAGVYFRPNAQVPVRSTGFNVAAYGGSFPFMYDVADLYFLTPQMLKKTRNIS